MKRTMKLLLLAALSILMLACGGKKDKAAPSKTEIVLWEQMEPAVRTMYLELVDEFMAANPDVVVKVAHYSTEDLRTQFQNASLAGQGPDLVYGPNDNIGIFLVSDLIKPVTDVVSGDFIAKFDENTLNTGVVNGEYYSLPEFNGNQIALLYNKDLVESAPETWDEFLEVSQGIRNIDNRNKENSRYGFLYNEKEPFWFIGLYHGYGGDVFDKEYNPTLNNEAMVKALQFASDVRGKYGLGEAGMDYGVADQLFKQGKAAFILNGAWSWKEYEEAGINLGIAPMAKLPGGDTPLFTSASKGYSISETVGEEKYEAINKFFDFIFEAENNANISLAQAQAPAITAAREVQSVKDDELMQVSIATIDKTVPMYIVPEMRAVWDAMRPNLEGVINGQMTPEEAAAKMQADAEQGIRTIHGE
ncbi:maltose ABC transporter substrate-binding protein [Propionigenium maris DSM 9537]|uniref:Maltose ABC transporter substrate-binding protein n=1 Tax=Propionigenium maris DSM 9537 TaxID=1123000 RepID=A0A9W6GLN3_9FUSO|nr:extracellular solute-binding protein [Propionigenium maris]GLI56096.1 maltose ABC transporter substrate-binding protein [Propionigenium maris DSM 9537]